MMMMIIMIMMLIIMMVMMMLFYYLPVYKVAGHTYDVNDNADLSFSTYVDTTSARWPTATTRASARTASASAREDSPANSARKARHTDRWMDR